MRKKVWITSVLLLIMLITGCGGGIKDSFSWEIDDFKSINHEGKETMMSDFEGEVLIVDFIFTNCATVCLPMTANMVELQEKLKDKKLNTEIISISVDPDVDTPEVLKEYVLGYDGDLSNWTLLTGYAQQFIENYAIKNFKTVVKKPGEGDQVIHGSSFFLVNQDGRVVKEYSGLTVPFDEIINDVNVLISEG